MDNKKTHNRDNGLSFLGFSKKFDLHSAIFAVCRLMNYGDFDIDWDIKRILIPDYDNLDEWTKKSWKKLLNRCFFSKSSGQAGQVLFCV